MEMKTSPTGPAPRSFIEEARRAQVVAAAARTVAEVGYANASLARIAERAGISKSVISYHFAGKDELMTLVATEFFQEAWEHMEPLIAAEETAVGQVRAWVGSQLEYFARHRTRFLAMIDVVASHRGPDGSRPFAEAEDEEVEGLTEILRAGQQAGELRDFDPRAVATIIIRCTEGVLGSWAIDDRVDLTAQAQTLLDFIDHAIRQVQP